MRVAGGQSSFFLAAFDQIQQDRERLFRSFCGFRVWCLDIGANCQAAPTRYSARRASTGEMRAALRAGI